MTLALDELIIVNPGSPRRETSWFLGADGGLYRLGRPTASRHRDPPRNEVALGDAETVPRLFLGDDGLLYETL
jgi:hypothetical protein